jgi:acyl transferase domain-containing protein
MFREIEARGVFVREVPVRYAFHSFHMDPVQDELLASLAGLQPHEAEVKIFSTVTGRQAEGTDFDAAYWWRNVRQSVLFAPAIQSMIEAGFTHFVEISPHPVLSNVLAECLAKAEATGLVVPSLRRQKPERARMLAALGMLHVNGHAVDWAARHPEVRHEVRLPDYPWQKERYWNESLYSYRERVQPGAYHLLYRKIDSVHPTWETLLNKESLGWLKDHRVGQHIIFPGAGYVAMALAAGSCRSPACGRRTPLSFKAHRWPNRRCGRSTSPAACVPNPSRPPPHALTWKPSGGAARARWKASLFTKRRQPAGCNTAPSSAA